MCVILLLMAWKLHFFAFLFIYIQILKLCNGFVKNPTFRLSRRFKDKRCIRRSFLQWWVLDFLCVIEFLWCNILLRWPNIGWFRVFHLKICNLRFKNAAEFLVQLASIYLHKVFTNICWSFDVVIQYVLISV